MKKLQFVLLALLCITSVANGQNPKIEELESKLQKTKGIERQKLLLELANEYLFVDPQKSIQLSDSCLSMSKDIDIQNNARLTVISAFINIGEFDTVQNYLLPKARENYSQLTDSKTYADYYNLSAGVKLYTGQYDSALYNWSRALEYLNKTNDSTGILKFKVNIAMVYSLKGDYQTAIDMFYEVLSKLEPSADKETIATIYSNLAGTYSGWGNNDKALEFYLKSYILFKEIGDEMRLSAMLSNIGEIYKGKRDYQQALRYYQEALDLNEKSGNNNYESITLLNIGETYTLTGKFQKGLVYSEKALIIFKKMNFVEGIGRSWANIGRSYIGLKKYDDALSAIETSQRIALQLGLPDLRIQNLLSFSEIYESTGKLSDALDAYRKYSALKDSVFDSDKIKAIAEMQTKYETEKKEQHLMLQQVELEKNKSRQNVLMAWLIAGFVFIVIVVWAYIVKWRSNIKITLQRDEIEEKNAVLYQQQEEIIAQTESLEQANQEISDKKREIEQTHNQLLKSIHYARQMQAAVLPSVDELDAIIPKYFLMFNPCDVVSGDFYWARKQDHKLLIVVGDCTGHGIPGAMMSMYAISLLNEIYSNEKLLHPEELLEKLRIHVKTEINVKQNEARHKTQAETYFGSHIKDGIDMAVCFIDINTKRLEYAGANNPAYIISNGQLIELQPVFNPVGVFVKEMAFERLEFDLKENDEILIFTDGFIDQFGGPENRKYNTARFKDLLVDVSQKTMQEQKSILTAAFEQWKQNAIQTDDVTVLGIRV